MFVCNVTGEQDRDSHGIDALDKVRAQLYASRSSNGEEPDRSLPGV